MQPPIPLPETPGILAPSPPLLSAPSPGSWSCKEPRSLGICPSGTFSGGADVASLASPFPGPVGREVIQEVFLGAVGGMGRA